MFVSHRCQMAELLIVSGDVRLRQSPALLNVLQVSEKTLDVTCAWFQECWLQHDAMAAAFVNLQLKVMTE